MPLSVVECLSDVMDQETAEALGSEVAKKIYELLEGHGGRYYVCLVHHRGYEAGTGSHSCTVHSNERKPTYGMSPEDCENDQFRGETKGRIWGEDDHFQ